MTPASFSRLPEPFFPRSSSWAEAQESPGNIRQKSREETGDGGDCLECMHSRNKMLALPIRILCVHLSLPLPSAAFWERAV
ncbi:hypothetical protein EYF80_049004 [Liparis tanakae]|uniref:Uncharacterized protein n=1 Tax=Liparis tanakae TaxID=230148 RepID=A0A4Z2FIQ5_9TELE|nr:hypothetical protein EYF80_049004 [Liparis tanakae]